MRLTLTFVALLSTLLVSFVPAPAQAEVAEPCIGRICINDEICYITEPSLCEVPQLPCQTVRECCYIFDPSPCSTDYIPRPYVRDNYDGSYTVGYTYCDSWGWCYDNDIATVDTNVDICRRVPALCQPLPPIPPLPPVPGALCFTYNPEALTNACVGASTYQQGFTHTGVQFSERRTCVIGQEGCVTHAWAGTTTTTTYVTLVDTNGYVEITAACGFSAPCRVNL